MPEPQDDAVPPGETRKPHWLVASLYARRGVLTSLAILAGLAFATQAAWQAVQPQIAKNERYLVTPASVTVPPPPPWVRGDVVAEAFQAGKLTGELSVLDPPEKIAERLTSGLTTHPWVRRIGAIQASPPNRLSVEIEYRTPVATVMLAKRRTPTDIDGVALPTDTLSAEYLERLPRIGVASSGSRQNAALPLRAGSWPSTEIAGAASLIAAFGPAFGKLDLFEVQIDPVPAGGAGTKQTCYQLRSRGNTIVVWGAAPGREPAGQPTFDVKLQWLRAVIQREGPLDSVAVGPALIDVREGANSYPRVVMKGDKRLAAKPDEEDATAVK
ncbi:MAG: hypothetical protein AAF266_07435 [Planctomycetota bacterium]